MASGRLAAVEPSATTNTSLYIPPTDKVATCTVNVNNRAAATRTIRVAIVDGAVGDIADADYILYERTLNANGDSDQLETLQITGIVLSDADRIVIRASGVDVSFVVWGFEEAE